MSEADDHAPGGIFVDGPNVERPQVHHLFGARPVLPMLNSPDNLIEKITLCRITGEKSKEEGFCPVHGTDACLALYVRYNYVMEEVTKAINDAKLEVSRRVR